MGLQFLKTLSVEMIRLAHLHDQFSTFYNPIIQEGLLIKVSRQV